MTQVKICGITNIQDAMVAADAGADLLGFIFYPNSPRYIVYERAREIAVALRERGRAPKIVGVFVNESLERVRAIVTSVRLDLVQLAGTEPAQVVQGLSPRAYKSLRPRDESEASQLLRTYRAAVNGNTPAFIVDSFDMKRFGGTGERADWNLAAKIAREFSILLAGGLNAENVADAIHIVQPWGVDVSSGVEHAPGLKDHVKVRRFVERAKKIE